jgi:hypothetical protein
MPQLLMVGGASGAFYAGAIDGIEGLEGIYRGL